MAHMRDVSEFASASKVHPDKKFVCIKSLVDMYMLELSADLVRIKWVV